jgi:hypothetical protein
MAQYGPGQGPRGFLTAGRQYGMGPVIESAVANQMVATSAAAQSVIRQQLTPLIASCAFTPALGLVAAGSSRTCFIDANGANQNSGVTQTNASQTFSRGITKSGTRSFLLGLGVQVYSNLGSTVATGAPSAPEPLEPGEVIAAIHRTSLKLNIGSAEQQLGPVACWPAGTGAFGFSGTVAGGAITNEPHGTNGAPSLDALTYFSDVVVLDPFINFSVDVNVNAAINVATSQGAAVQSVLGYTLWFPRIIDFSTQQKAGA